MANEEHLSILKQGVDVWNKWREENPGMRPDLRVADFSGASLSGADFSEADLSRTSLSGADLRGTLLNKAFLDGEIFGEMRAVKVISRDDFDGSIRIAQVHFLGADLRWARLNGAHLVGADLQEVRLHWVPPIFARKYTLGVS